MFEVGWFGFLQMLGALALFIYGMKVMSEGVQRIASQQLRVALQRVTQNKFSSFLTGFLTTTAIQSSSASTVMTVSFVNAGIISLTAAAGIIIGANVATTGTAWFVTILGFELNLFTLCLPLIGLALPFFYVKNGKYRHWAETVIGFALLLIALQFLKSIAPELQRRTDILFFLGKLANDGLLSIMLFIVFGAVLSALIQSSGAAMALTLTMCLNGWIPFEIGAAMVLGENIGTTLAAEVASWVGNTESKVAARIHILYNVISVFTFLPFLPVVLPFISWFMMTYLDLGDPKTHPWTTPVGLAIFFTLYNVIYGILFLVSMPFLIKLASRTVKDVGPEFRRKYFIDTGSNTADLSLPIAMQEIAQQCQRVKNLNSILNKVINFTMEAEYADQIKFAREYLQTLQNNHKSINKYLISLVEDKSSLVTSRQIKSLLNINLLMDHIRNKYEHIYTLIEEKKSQRIWFGPTQRSILLHQINDATVLLKRSVQLLNSGSFQRISWRGLSMDISEKKQDYLDYEKELMQELDRGEMKLVSVVIYYRISQIMDSINEALRSMLNELTDEPVILAGKQVSL